ncbi:MAG: glutathione S-transferase family protein [Gammaproteobacteria bacterium]|nr:glutathione S-transferase family protein [Gammaproteobacteria bacterium]
MKIYGDFKSGNCYKLKLACALLDIAHEWVPLDILQGDTRSDEFLALNPNGQIPVCVLDDGEVLAESNAILYYLARDSSFWPQHKLLQTRILEWQFFEQYNHEPSIAVARFIKVYQNLPQNRVVEHRAKLKAGYRALDIMERHLARHEYLVSDNCTIADISLFAYTHVAHEGGFNLSKFPAIEAWISRIQSQPGFVGMYD